MDFEHLKVACRDGFSRVPLLLIYQMGKVASQTIQATLNNSDVGRKITRLHYLSSNAIAASKRQLHNRAVPENTKESIRYQIDVALRLYYTLAARRIWRMLDSQSPKVEMIVGVREPVGFMLASIFQNHTAFFPSLDDVDPDACRDILLQAPSVSEDHRRFMDFAFSLMSEWFDEELKTVAGIDVYATPFPREKGYAIVENKHVRALVYRFENLNRMKPMLEEFLQREISSISSQNIGREKDYGEAYARVKEKLRLPQNFLEHTYAIRMVRHFYSEKERQELTARWSSGATIGFRK